MKRFLLPHLICPACLPKEYPLNLTTDREADNDIITGTLACTKCKRRFPIKEGIAHLLPDPDSSPAGAQWRYEEKGMTDRYLWSHYSDLLGDTVIDDSAIQWANCLSRTATAGFDAGCSVGRITFEMANRCDLAVGCDLSHGFIKTARRLAQQRQLDFSLPLEGNLTEQFQLSLPASWRTDNVEFVIADVLRLPFSANCFDQIASLNLLDRVSYPLAHLFEMNRVAAPQNASFLFADPFSWSTTAAPEEHWLGGTTTGPYKGRGKDNVRALLEGKERILVPAWTIAQTGTHAWKMRTHCNHYEVITSEYLVAKR
ncbi:MAG: methyltransferase domain-containing protein [Geobacteraceae bacterium]|nr:methyltransferase domain-containing protein [Geobacteraceae bacterium]